MTSKRDGRGLWKALKDQEAQDDLDLVLAMSDAELDAYIAANGGDPQPIRASGAALATELLERRQALAWQGDMRSKLGTFRETADASRTKAKLPRKELLARLEVARKNPRFAAPVATLFQKKTRGGEHRRGAAGAPRRDRAPGEAGRGVSKVRPLAPISVAAARRVLAECDVRDFRELDVEAIGARYGMMTPYGPVATARASIVRAGARAVVRIDETSRGTPRASFTGAHELGHFLLHPVIDHFEQCRGDEKRSGTAFRVEREASDFSVELLIPEPWGALHCAAPRPTVDDVARLARRARTSLEMTASRYVQLTEAPCAVVLSVSGLVKRSLETRSFPGKIVKNRVLHASSLAALSKTSGREIGPREVPGDAWGGRTPFVEHAIQHGPDRVLSWVIPAA